MFRALISRIFYGVATFLMGYGMAAGKADEFMALGMMLMVLGLAVETLPV